MDCHGHIGTTRLTIQLAIPAVSRGEAAIDLAIQHHVVDTLARSVAAEEGVGGTKLPDGLTTRRRNC